MNDERVNTISVLCLIAFTKHSADGCTYAFTFTLLGGREKWLVDGLNRDKTVINEILNELSSGSALLLINKMKQYKFSDDLCKEVINNWNNLRKDLEAEGVEF